MLPTFASPQEGLGRGVVVSINEARTEAKVQFASGECKCEPWDVCLWNVEAGR